jgi:EAL domain-containing protein (putative c-di-GMP-specific phosphodiesterase class I)
MPFDQIKIDKALVTTSMRESEPFSYLQFLTNLCSEKDVLVTLEGVETRDMMQRFVQMNVQLLQGYYFSLPLIRQDAMSTSCHINMLEQAEMGWQR